MFVRLSSVLRGLGVRRLAPVRRTTGRTCRSTGSLMLLSPANSNGALTFLLPLMRALGTSVRNIRTLMLMPSHRLTLRVRAIFGSVKAPFGTVDYCNKHPTVRRRQAVGNVRPAIVVNAPKHVDSRLEGRGFGTTAIIALIVSRFSGYLRFNFRSRVTRIVKRLPSLGGHILLSTASTRRVPRFTKMKNSAPSSNSQFVGLSFLTPRTLTPHLQLRGIISPRGSGLRALCGLLYALNCRSALMFYGCHRDIRHITKCLGTEGFPYSVFRKNVRRPSHRHTLCGFHGNDYTMLVSASLTTHKLSVPNVRGIIRCRPPMGRRTCARHGKHATH